MAGGTELPVTLVLEVLDDEAAEVGGVGFAGLCEHIFHLLANFGWYSGFYTFGHPTGLWATFTFLFALGSWHFLASL